MRIDTIVKVEPWKYSVTSPSCPMCKSTLTVEIDSANLYLYNQGASIEKVLPNLSPEERECFITGYCPPCWDKLFPDE